MSITSGVLWWQYVTYASSCIIIEAFSGYRLWCKSFLFHISEGIWLVALPKTDWDKTAQWSQMSALKPFSVYLCRLLSDDLSRVSWSLVKLVAALQFPLHATRWKLLWYTLCGFQGKMALPVILCCVTLIIVMSLILFRHLGGTTLFWVVRCLPIMLLGDRALCIIFWSARICHNAIWL